MARIDIDWCLHDGVWQRTIGNLAVWAFVRLVNHRYEIATGTNGNPRRWEDYCADHDGAGGRTCQEYKAKRRATTMARKLIKDSEANV